MIFSELTEIILKKFWDTTRNYFPVLDTEQNNVEADTELGSYVEADTELGSYVEDDTELGSYVEADTELGS